MFVFQVNSVPVTCGIFTVAYPIEASSIRAGTSREICTKPIRQFSGVEGLGVIFGRIYVLSRIAAFCIN